MKPNNTFPQVRHEMKWDGTVKADTPGPGKSLGRLLLLLFMSFQSFLYLKFLFYKETYMYISS